MFLIEIELITLLSGIRLSVFVEQTKISSEEWHQMFTEADRTGLAKEIGTENLKFKETSTISFS